MDKSIVEHVQSVGNPAEICKKLFRVEQSGSILLVRCYMNYTSSNMLGNIHQYKYVDGHLWMYISEGTENWLPF